MAEPVQGLRDLQKKLKRLGPAVGGKVLRSAAMTAMLPAVKAAKAAIPVGNPPYEGRNPYPVRTYKGRLRTPGFAKRNIARKSRISKDKRAVRVMLGVKPEAFYAVNFVELGTSKMPKQPWLEPSFRNSRDAVQKRLADQLARKIEKEARKR